MMKLADKVYQTMSENKLYGEVYESVPGKLLNIEISGDWKWDHVRLNNLIEAKFPELQYLCECVHNPQMDDCYESTHQFRII